MITTVYDTVNDTTTKATYMEQARAHGPEILKRYKAKMKTIKSELWDKLQKKNRKKRRQKRQNKLYQDLNSQMKLQLKVVFGVVAIINNKCDDLFTHRTDEEVSCAIYTQLQFHQKVLKSAASRKDLFQLSATI